MSRGGCGARRPSTGGSVIDQSISAWPAAALLLAVAGALCFLGAFAAVQVGALRARGYAFLALNGTAAALMAPLLLDAFGWAAAVFLALWIALALGAALRIRRLSAQMKISPDEEPVVKAMVPGLPNDRARLLLGRGQWQDPNPGTVLTQEGEPARWLIYLAEGRCVVEHDGERIATLEPGSLIGEITFLSGAPATATVRTAGRTRIFSLETRALRRMLEREDDIRIALERRILSVLGLRLTRTTDDIARLKRRFEQAGLTGGKRLRRR